MCWLASCKAVVQTLGQIYRLKRNIKKYFFVDFLPLSRFLAITLRVNKIAMKSFTRSCCTESNLSSFIIQHIWCEKLGVILTILTNTYVYMDVRYYYLMGYSVRNKSKEIAKNTFLFMVGIMLIV